MKSKVHLGKEQCVSAELLLRLVGIYWISSVTKCKMNHIVCHPRGRAGEEGLSIRADLQSSHSLHLLESSPADCSSTSDAPGP